MSTQPIRPLTRRQLLQAAGGITFSALIPVAEGACAPAHKASGAAPQVLFTALPYLQPGTSSSKLVAGKESLTIVWQTNNVPAAFDLEYGPDETLGKKALLGKTERLAAQDGETRWNHTATLTGLPLNKRCHYRVRMNGEKLLEGYFTTRKPRGVKTRFVAFGDNSCGLASDHAIAFQAYRARPDFVMNTGDNVYSRGLDSEYARHFFPVYNSETADPAKGAPLLRSIPYYSVIANHDMSGKDAVHGQLLDFTAHSDGGAYYTNWHFPLNGPRSATPTPVTGDAQALAHFTACAGARFPNMANYSFDYGDVHFLCLDSNVYVDPTDAALQAWIAQDLSATDAAWKFVVYHHPAFNVGANHYTEQQMRVLSPLFEQHGVAVVLSGHEHNYQRTRPLRFAPADLAGAKHIGSGKRLVPGRFTVDRQFDGTTVTKPNGILYITTGAGGNDLYDPQSNNNPPSWKHREDDNVEYVTRLISDRHSLTVLDVDARTLTIRQVDSKGEEIDLCHITKA